MGNNLVGGGENGIGGAVVLFEADDLCILELGFKGKNIADVRSCEFIDTLIVIPHHAQLASLGKKGD